MGGGHSLLGVALASVMLSAGLALAVARQGLVSDAEPTPGEASAGTLLVPTDDPAWCPDASPVPETLPGDADASTSYRWSKGPVDAKHAGVSIDGPIIAGGPGFMAAANVDGPALLVSSNGRRWTRVGLEGSHGEWLVGIARMCDGYVALGQADSFVPALWSSSDGTAWRRQPVDPALTGLGFDVIGSWAGGLVGVGCRAVVPDDEHYLQPVPSCEGLLTLAVSADGLAWHAVPTDVDFEASVAVLPVDDEIIVLAWADDIAGTVTLMHSANGSTWTESHPEVGLLHDVAVGTDGLLAVSSGRIVASSDGETWSPVDAPIRYGDRIAVLPADPVAGRPQDLIVVSGWIRQGRTEEAAVWWRLGEGPWKRALLPAGGGRTFNVTSLAISEQGRVALLGYEAGRGESGFRPAIWIGTPTSGHGPS
jgi:hypothetical protein